MIANLLSRSTDHRSIISGLSFNTGLIDQPSTGRPPSIFCGERVPSPRIPIPCCHTLEGMFFLRTELGKRHQPAPPPAHNHTKRYITTNQLQSDSNVPQTGQGVNCDLYAENKAHALVESIQEHKPDISRLLNLFQRMHPLLGQVHQFAQCCRIKREGCPRRCE